MLIDQDPVYIPVKPGVVAYKREFAGGDAVAGYNWRGELLGVDLSAPVSPSVWDAITEPIHEDCLCPADAADLRRIPR